MENISVVDKLKAVNKFFEGNDFIITNDDRIFCKFENEYLDEDELDEIIEVNNIKID